MGRSQSCQSSALRADLEADRRCPVVAPNSGLDEWGRTDDDAARRGWWTSTVVGALCRLRLPGGC